MLARSAAPGALETYRKILLAAASPPVMFPPVEIDGFLLADGGTRDRLLVVGLGGPSSGQAFGPDVEPGNVYTIFNDKMVLEPEAIRADLKEVAASSLKSLLNSQMEATLVHAYALSQVHGYSFKLIRIPQDVRLGPDPLAFDPRDMMALFEVGRGLGREPGSWNSTPPPGQNVTPWLVKVLTDLRE